MGERSRGWPPAFLERMEELLDGELPDFLAALEEGRARGLRLNPAKVGPGELADLLGLELDPVPWCPTGYTFAGRAGLGAHPAHRAGLFYLQDPAAMSVVEVLDPQPGWLVADLAAAPGGKTTHLLARLRGTGLVVANEVVGSRLRMLHENLDRWGGTAAVTLGMELEGLAARLPGAFDAVLLDAPCTGEALLRREPDVISQWSQASVAGSARRQRRLLEAAARLVRPGGVLVYSTCSFEVEEDEGQVSALLDSSPEWELVEVARPEGFDPGVRVDGQPTERSVRLWPHRAQGDGQFVARLRRRGHATGMTPPGGARAAAADAEIQKRWDAFRAGSCPGLDLPPGRLVARGSHLYHLPETAGHLARLPLVRPGLPLGELRPGRFQPSQALACVLGPEQAGESVSWPAGHPLLDRYLAGEAIESPGPDGWVLVCYERWGLGWGRRSQGVLKNFLPHSLRSRASSPHRAAMPLSSRWT